MNPYASTLLGQLDRRYLNNPHARRAAVIVVAGLAIGLAVQAAYKSTKQDEGGARELLYGAGTTTNKAGPPPIARTEGAFGRWMYDLRQVRDHGKDPYRDLWFPTPPVVLVMLSPFVSLSPGVGGVLWAVLKLAAAITAIAMTIKAISRADRPLPFGVGLLAVVFGIRPLIGDVQHGNINLLVLWCVCATLYLWSRGRDTTAGLSLGLAVMMKVTPALLVVYYLYRRQWRVLAGAAIGGVAFGFVVPAIAFGPTRTIHYYREWYGVMIEPVRDGWITFDAKNQSLPGTVFRWAYAAYATNIESIPLAGAMKYGSDELARPTTAAVAWAIKGLQLALVAALALLCRGRRTDRKDPRYALEFTLVLLAMLMLSERTWKHHCVTLPVVYAAVWYGLACFAWTERFRGVFASGLGVQFALLVLSGEEIIGRRFGESLLYNGVIFVGLLLCFAQTAWLLRKRWEPLAATPTPIATGGRLHGT